MRRKLHIGYTGPISLPMLTGHVPPGAALPAGYAYPLGANLVQEYLKLGHRVTVFTLDKHIREPITVEGPLLKICVGHMRWPAVRRVFDCFGLERRYLTTAIRASSCDVIHAQWTYEFATAALASHPRVLVTARDAPGQIIKHMTGPFRLCRYLLSRVVVKRAKNMSAVSPYISDYFIQHMGYRGEIPVVPNGLPDSFVADAPKCLQNKKRLSILCNSGWSGLKNPKQAIRGFNLALQRDRRIKLIMCGWGMEPGGIAEKWARAKKISDGIEFLGHIDYARLQALLCEEVNICLHTSREESFSMAIVEAMAKGVPCIGGHDSGAVPWVLDNGKAGVIVDIDSPWEIRDCILRLTQESSYYNSIAAVGLERVKRKFSLSKVAQAYVTILKRLYEK